ITPIYLGYPREAVVELLIPAFLPFNLLKGGLNASIAMLIYKPLSKALRSANLMPRVEEASTNGKKVTIGSVLVSSLIIVSCILLILEFQGCI
ncbi:MAG: ECF transporter S component, partial [Ruminiclostridium sp.]|nr:ECF transporter S component [Ruminiclostridium sp.]